MRPQIPTDGAVQRDRVAAAFADSQHGVIARQQLLAASVSESAIRRSVAAGRLHPMFRGTYSVGHASLTAAGWWMAALLSCGARAALSHRTAAALWRMLDGPALPVEVTTPNDRGRADPRMVTHRSRLADSEVVVCDGLRVTTPSMTIVDLAGSLTASEIRRVIERAQDLDRFRPAEIRRLLGRRPKPRGARPRLDLVQLMTPASDGTRSHLERLFLRLVRRAGLPPPAINAVIAGRSRDFSWPKPKLVAEVDGHRWHSSRRARRRDAQRDRELTALGWRPVRFTYEDVAFEPELVSAELAGLVR